MDFPRKSLPSNLIRGKFPSSLIARKSVTHAHYQTLPVPDVRADPDKANPQSTIPQPFNPISQPADPPQSNSNTFNQTKCISMQTLQHVCADLVRRTSLMSTLNVASSSSTHTSFLTWSFHPAAIQQSDIQLAGSICNTARHTSSARTFRQERSQSFAPRRVGSYTEFLYPTPMKQTNVAAPDAISTLAESTDASIKALASAESNTSVSPGSIIMVFPRWEPHQGGISSLHRSCFST